MSKKEEYQKYFRIGVSYFKEIEKPTLSGDKISSRVHWNEKTIIRDYGKSFLDKIPKLDGFCCIPSHTNYNKIIDKCFNTYHELPYQPKEDNIKTSLEFVKHIFGDQQELGLDYLKILYEYPVQILPILSLVSKERGTGKSTFIKWLKAMFDKNMTYIKGDSFSSQFNSDWADKLIIAIDEVFFDKKEITERLKYLSTTNSDKIEAKGKDKVEIEFFGKFILCSNNEDTFILIDSNEIRFWVRKIKPFEKEDTEFLPKLIKEIPAFLYYLKNRKFSTPKLTRMWFTPEQIRTKALIKLMWLNNNKLERDMVQLFYEIFDTISADEIKTTPRDVASNLKKINRKGIDVNEVRKVLKKKWEIKPSDNTNSYTGYEYTSYGEFIEIDRKGRFYIISRDTILKIFDDLMID